MKLTLHPVRPKDVHDLSLTMRPEDAAECYAAEGLKPFEAVRESLRQSSFAQTVRVDGEVAGIYGVAPMALLGSVGQSWLLTSEAIKRAPLAFFKTGRVALRQMLERYETLVSFIDARYTKAVRFFGALGYRIEPAQPFGFSRLPFHRAVLEKNLWAS